jgi:hypothetical protein
MSRRTIAKVAQEGSQNHARVIYDTEWGEYIVRFYHHAQRLEDADYHTTDRADALGTAKLWAAKGVAHV